MAALLVPAAIVDYLGLLGAGVAETAIAEGANATLVNAGVAAGQGAILNAVTSEINDIAVSIVGQENIDKAKKTVNDIFGEASAAFNQDASYFLNKNRDAYNNRTHKSSINFNNEDVKLHQLAQTQPTKPSPSSQPSPGITPSISANFSTKDVSDFVVGYANGIVAQSDSGKIDRSQALASAIAQNPSKNQDLAKLLGPLMFGVIPSNDFYKGIASVYNGVGMEIAKNIVMKYDPEKKLIYFVLTDELGSTSVMYQTTGVIIPAIHGYFMGPKSPNNNLPVDLVDLFSAFHDQSWENGPNQTGDYQYISRMTQNYYRMDDTERKYAKIGILYFSTMGHLVTRLVGNDGSVSSSDQGVKPSDTSSNIQGINPQVNVGKIDLHTVLNPGIMASPVEKDNFNKQFIEDIKTSSGLHGVVSGNNFKNSALLDIFDSIRVELL